jgi:hypothetical protein
MEIEEFEEVEVGPSNRSSLEFQPNRPRALKTVGLRRHRRDGLDVGCHFILIASNEALRFRLPGHVSPLRIIEYCLPVGV